MDNITPNVPSTAADSALQDRFNRDVQVSIRQLSGEVEVRLSALSARIDELRIDLDALIVEWREFYDVEWPAEVARINQNESDIADHEARIQVLEAV